MKGGEERRKGKGAEGEIERRHEQRGSRERGRRRGRGGEFNVHVEVDKPSKLNKEKEALMRRFAHMREEKEGESQMQRPDGGFFSKFRDAFGR